MNAEQFNKIYPIGSPVIYRDDFGELHETATRSAAWEISQGDVLVALNGRAGGHDVNRISKRRM